MEAHPYQMSEERSGQEETPEAAPKAEVVDGEDAAIETEHKVSLKQPSRMATKIQRPSNHHRSLEETASLVAA